jgi:4,5-dihydroxyphthalate decarboxylase
MHLKTLLGDYPVTAALKSGAVSSPLVALDFADVKVPNTAFKRVVRDLEFDVAELAIVTFLMAKAQGAPLALLPTVVVGRYQHPFLVHDTRRGLLAPRDLAGRRIGIRSWTVTTVAWLRSILADDYGVDLTRIKWVTFEDAHVPGFADPPGVERAAPGKDLTAMLRAGELDAAVLAGVPDDVNIQPVISDPAAAARDWTEKYGAIQINHLVAVRTELCERHPDTVREIYRMLVESKRATGLPQVGQLDSTPFGIAANRRNLEIAIDMTHRQGLIPHRFTVDEILADPIREIA